MRGFVTVVAFLVAGCHGGLPPEGALHDEQACLLADSLLRESGLTGDFKLMGRTTIDVNQYRVRGRFALTVSQDDDVVLEFTSTSPMGGRREDFVISLYQDTLRIFDRERAELYVGEDVATVVLEETGVPIDLTRLIPLVFARMPDCHRLTAMELSSTGEDLSGLVDGERFDLSFADGRLALARWPLLVRGGGPRERIEVKYRWEGGTLSRITALVRERSWRIRLDAN